MGRRKVTTSVNLDPDIFQRGREAGYNFSQLLQEKIIEKNDPQQEVMLLKNEIRYHEEQITKLQAKLEIVEREAQKAENAKINNVLGRYVPIYKQWGFLSDRDLARLADNLKIGKEEVNNLLEEQIKTTG